MLELKLKNVVIKTPVFSAPLAGVSDFAFREIIRDFSPNTVCFSEMISCYSFIEHIKQKKLTPQEEIEPNIIAQIFGDNIEKMVESAKILEGMGAVAIDINMGCPVKKVLKAGAGCAYLENISNAGKVIESIAKAIKIPTTVKTRIGLNDSKITIFEFVKMAEQSGADMITIHGRTKTQLYSGYANWDIIKQAKEIAKIPVIGNGDIVDIDTFNNAVKTGVDGVMIGRGLLGKPWLIKECIDQEKYNPTINEIREVCLKHLKLTCNLYGEFAGIKIFRKHASWYSFGMQGASEFRAKINNTDSRSNMEDLINQFLI